MAHTHVQCQKSSCRVWRCRFDIQLVEMMDVFLVGTGTAAILAVGGSKPTVTVDENGRFGVQKVMKCNLTCDHRIVYGAGAAEFMLELKSVIENPEQLTF